MGYILNEDQKSLVAMAHDFCEKEIKPYAAQRDRDGVFPLESYKKAMEIGYHCLEIPEEYGGGGIDYVTVAAVMEEFAKYDLGFATTLMGTTLSLKPVLMHGTPEQKKMYADVIVGGGLGAFALTEAGAGSDAAACRDAGVKGLSAFIVERDRAGFSVDKHEDKMGIRTSDTASLVFDNVRIPADHLLGKEGEGFKCAMPTLDLARPFVAASAVGLAQRAVDEAVKYAKERICFGKPIAKLQAIQFMLADMEIGVETARQMVIHTLQLAEAHLPYGKEAAVAKCYAGDVAFKVAGDAVQVLGGYGYSREYPVEKLMRDAKLWQIFEGTNQVQRMVIAGAMAAGK